MYRLSGILLRRRRLVIIIFAALALICACMALFTGVNYDLSDYLPEDVNSSRALRVMAEEFPGGLPDTRVMVRGVSLTEALGYKARLAGVDGVSDIMWLDDVCDITKPLELQDSAVTEAYYRDGTALFTLAVRDGSEERVIDDIYSIIGDNGSIAGSAAETAVAQKLAVGEVIKAAYLLVPLIIVILLISTTSWLEPLLFLGAIGVSVLINMGLNLLFGEVSFITSSVSPILQLAVSLDYAIFLLHSFEEKRRETDNVVEAMRLAMKRSLLAVLASALTTVFGFLALVFMRFGIGSDLGLTLVRGILISLISVMVFLPTLTVACVKALDKTRHRKLMPSFKKAGGRIMKLKLPVLILVALLIVPSFLAQRANHFSYGMGELEAGSRAGLDKAAVEDTFGRSVSLVLLVPRGAPSTEDALCSELGELEHVTAVTSYSTSVGSEIPDEFLDEATASMFYSENYARIIVSADTAADGNEAFAVVEAVRALGEKYYGGEVLSCGESANMYDMREVTSADASLVNMIAIIAIALVLVFSFKSASLPLILVLAIETSIWLNLSVPYFSGNIICYIGYLVVSTVQLGATVDYAILFTDHYVANRRLLGKKSAVTAAVSETMGSILTSATVLAAAGFIIGLVSTNEVVSQLGTLLGRGTVLSALMVLLFLPAALTLLDGVIKKTTLGVSFAKNDADASEDEK